MSTVKVRIAVGVDPTGKWYGLGYTSMTPSDAFDFIDCLEPGEARYWVEATLAVPEAPTVEGIAKAEASPQEGS